MTTTLAFDVYGTLIDPLLIAQSLEQTVGADAARFARIWREKQIEYLFRRALMHRYETFTVCTRQALEFTCGQTKHALAEDDVRDLMARYRELPPYPDVVDALEDLRRLEVRCYAFSNGEPAELEALMNNAGLSRLLDGIVSVHDVRSFKPDPAVYAHFLTAVDARPADTWLVSGNAFDILGAQACGWKTAWVARDRDSTFDPWGVEPTATIRDLVGLVDAI